MADDGLRLLAWLVEVETSGGHLSFTPTGGWGEGEPGPASTSSRWKRRPWPMPPPERGVSRATRSGRRGW